MKEDNKNKNQYDDIINLPHHVSSDHAHMSIADRAAQFSPFAALTGYEGAIKETARQTDRKIELDETEKNILDEKLKIVQENLNRQKDSGKNKEIELTFFRPDELKAGGTYVSIRGIVKKIDGYEHMVVMRDETRIPIEEIVDITGDLFQALDDFIVVE